jgi:hypoxanthine-DNA glycosylase
VKRGARAAAITPAARLTGLPPLAAVDARVLILGSMPGAASLQAQQYYAHPHNRFWPFMAAITGIELQVLSYDDRVRQLQTAGIAVWDVLQQCERAGSLDADIIRGSEIANDFATFFAAHRSLLAVFLNGGAAARAFARQVQPWLSAAHPYIAVTALPSTSPANASQPTAIKLAAWMQLADALSAGSAQAMDPSLASGSRRSG